MERHGDAKHGLVVGGVTTVRFLILQIRGHGKPNRADEECMDGWLAGWADELERGLAELQTDWLGLGGEIH